MGERALQEQLTALRGSVEEAVEEVEGVAEFDLLELETNIEEDVVKAEKGLLSVLGIGPK